MQTFKSLLMVAVISLSIVNCMYIDDDHSIQTTLAAYQTQFTAQISALQSVYASQPEVYQAQLAIFQKSLNDSVAAFHSAATASPHYTTSWDQEISNYQAQVAALNLAQAGRVSMM